MKKQIIIELDEYNELKSKADSFDSLKDNTIQWYGSFKYEHGQQDYFKILSQEEAVIILMNKIKDLESELSELIEENSTLRTENYANKHKKKWYQL